jgi:hypothetical protein
MVASAICAVGGTLGSVHSEWLFGPALVLVGMGLYQISRQRDDDKSS